MKAKLSKKRGISIVLTTVIILVASVVLASGVVLYGTSLFQGGTQTEAIRISEVVVWVHSTDNTGIAWGAVGVRNTGDKVVAVDKISIRGQNIPYSQWYADITLTNVEYQQTLNHTGWADISTTVTMVRTGECVSTITTYFCVDQDSGGAGTSTIAADAANGPITLSPGGTAVIYFKVNNGTITTLDTGASATVSIFAGKTGGPFAVVIRGS